jgi:hypothetical protein
MTTRIFPYPTLARPLDLDITYAEAQIGDRYAQISDDFFDRSSRVLDLSSDEYAGISEAKLNVAIEIPKSEYERLEVPSESVNVVVVSYCADTNSRTSVMATKSDVDSTNWTQSILLSRNQFRGTVQLTALLTGRAGGLDHRYLGASDAWQVSFDQGLVSTLRGTLPVKWVDFSSNELLKPHANEPWYGDLTEDPPTVYLNKNFEYLPELFREGVRKSKAQIALNEAQRTAIAKSVWLAMFQAAVAQITPGEDGSDPTWPEKWRAEVLRRILPKVYPDVDENEGLRLAHEALTSDPAYLESSALAVIGRDIVKEGKNLRKALSTVMSEGEE